MGIFDVFSKKKESLELPPPPMPDGDEHMMDLPEPPQDFAPISAPVEERMLEEEEHSHDEPMEEEAHEPEDAPMRVHRSSDGPIFLSVQDYQAILNGVTAMKSKLSATDESFRKLHEIKSAQDKQLEGWRTSLEDVQRKLTYVDEVLFGR